MAIQEGALWLVAEILAVAGCEPNRSPWHRNLVEAVRALLADRLEDALGLEELARAVAVSPYHLCRVFRAYAGETLHRYRNRLRLRAALEPVLDGADLSAVALASGYSSHSHFTAAFKREFGVTPSLFKHRAVGARVRGQMKDLGGLPRPPLPRGPAIF